MKTLLQVAFAIILALSLASQITLLYAQETPAQPDRISIGYPQESARLYWVGSKVSAGGIKVLDSSGNEIPGVNLNIKITEGNGWFYERWIEGLTGTTPTRGSIDFEWMIDSKPTNNSLRISLPQDTSVYEEITIQGVNRVDEIRVTKKHSIKFYPNATVYVPPEIFEVDPYLEGRRVHRALLRWRITEGDALFRLKGGGTTSYKTKDHLWINVIKVGSAQRSVVEVKADGLETPVRYEIKTTQPTHISPAEGHETQYFYPGGSIEFTLRVAAFVKDRDLEPIAGVPITFEAVENCSLGSPKKLSNTFIRETDTEGKTSIIYVNPSFPEGVALGTTAIVKAHLPETYQAETASTTFTIIVGKPAKLEQLDKQQVAEEWNAPWRVKSKDTILYVKVTDSQNHPVVGVPVRFQLVSGNGKLEINKKVAPGVNERHTGFKGIADCRVINPTSNVRILTVIPGTGIQQAFELNVP